MLNMEQMLGLCKLGFMVQILFLNVHMIEQLGLTEDFIMYEIVVTLFEYVILQFIVYLILIHGIHLLHDWMEGIEVLCG
jgi:hypothetical protein